VTSVEPASPPALAGADVITGAVVPTGGPAAVVDELPLSARIILGALAVLYDEWTTESAHRQQAASTAAPLGPKQMILGAEASVMLACADQLRGLAATFADIPPAAWKGPTA
jgi:hypothetical protein